MQYSLHDVFEQASRDHSACRYTTRESDSYLSYGTKIIKEHHTKMVVIKDTTKGEYYEEVGEGDYFLFKSYGWLYGVYVLSLAYYRQRIEDINMCIKKEVNNSRRKKHISGLREEREQMLRSYYKINQLLIKLNSK